MGLFVPHAPGTRHSRRLAWGYLALALLLMGGIGGAGYAYLRNERTDARRAATENLSAIGDLKVDQIAGWYRERRGDANTIFSTPLGVELNRFLEDPSDGGSRDRLLAWMRALQQEDDYSGVALLDGQGLVRLSVPSSMTEVDPHVLEECRRALRQRTVVIHGLDRHVSDPTVHLSLIVPLVKDRADAVLLLEIDAANSLFPLVQSWPTRSPTGEMLLVRREGDEVVYLNELRHRKGAALNLRLRIDEMPRLPAARVVSGHEGIFEGEDYRQVPVLAASRAIPGTPWFLVAKIDKAEIYAAFRRDVATTALLVAVLLLAAVSGVSVLWHRRGLAWAERELVLERLSLESERTFRAEADRAADELRLAHERLRQFVDANIVGIVIAAPDGSVLEANDYYLRMIGATREEFEEGKVDWQAITPAEWIPADERAIRELRERGTCTPYEKEYIRPDGTRVPVLLVDAMLPGPNPQIAAFVLDLTERKNAERELLRLTQILEASQAAARVGGWELDLVHDSLFWTDETYRIHDTSPSEYTPTLDTAIEFFTPESIPILREALQTPADRETRRDVDLELITRTGRRKWVHFTPSLTVERGRPVRLTCAIQDVTARILAERERLELTARLHQSQKLESLGSLAGGVAHDINNVLAAILSTASAHRRRMDGSDSLAHSLDTIVNACVRGRSVVRSLLYFARPHIETRGPVDLNAISREIVQLLEKTTLHRIRFETDLEEPLALVDGDGGAISHAVMNLCVNSLDAMLEGGAVTIRTRRRSEGFVEIRISDTGTGMTPEVSGRAIEPFFSTKPRGEGTGLGLAMVYGTVKAHEGTFEIVTAAGKGTEIILGFPVALARESKEIPLATAPAAPEPASARSLRILLVDDDDMVRDGVGSLLEIEGHEVHLAGGGPEALALFESDLQVDLVMLDMNMPGMSGAETLERLLAIRPEQIVLLSSGHGVEEMARLTTGRPHVLSIQKPFTLDELQGRLAALGLS
ncbi:MAG: PAS domain S-box protein, partial [Acidobacteria bacterium]|nr:PAS domain S-box protein [Acidobacteriota bacterium]